MKLALLLLLATLSGCVVVKERVRVEYRTLPPKVIEKVYYIVPDEAVQKQTPQDKVREAQKYA